MCFPPRPVSRPPTDAPSKPPTPSPVAALPALPANASSARNRVTADVTPEFLFGLFEGRTDIQARPDVFPYIGQWLRLSGPVGSVSEFNDYFSQVTFKGRHAYTQVYMYFRDKHAEHRLGMLRESDTITVTGRIDKVNRVTIDLEDCELLDWQPHSTGNKAAASE